MTDRAGEAPARRPVMSELGIYSSLYVAALPFLAAQTLGDAARPLWVAWAYCLLVGFGVYLLDRVGVARVDPADGAAWPRSARARGVARAAALLALGTASVMGWFIRSGLVFAPFVALAVVAAYAGPGRWRLKDSVWLKGPVVALCLVALGVLAVGADGALASPGAWATATGLVLIVLGDCTLSDIDDVGADRASGAGSVAARVGVRAAWAGALAVHVLAGGLLLVGMLAGVPGEADAGIGLWAAGLVATSWVLSLIRPRRVRALVDLRVPALALGVWGVRAAGF